MAATTTQMANAFASGAVFAGNLLPTSVSCSYSSKEALKDCSWVARTRAGFRTGCCKDDDGHSARPSTRRTGSLVKTMMMGLAEEVEEDQRQQHRGGPHGCSSSFANLIKNGALVASLSLALCLGSGVDMAMAKRLEGVNKPELLPKEYTTVIDVAGFLSEGQKFRIAQAVASLEEDTGFKLRVLAQNYPKTPGLAVREFWQVDDNTIVFVADPSLGNILNFNVGAGVDLSIPRSFWSRLAGKYGNLFYWQEKGEDASIEAAVSAIGNCLREPSGPRACSEIR
ncbi:hypothetical protein BDL97_01G005500 [Sphagnum fallax]|jgi:hypothetical protein|nr:hypothetical protein BDL97_01G005500 [Sphagnum fallax]KAH8972709.1 hypothetical protein BDL97_01G005500 [Sphagnum fallax]KAH8972710.1 hypothetical protein BDL97_01G005500 [Sphagnum fallax]